MILVRNNPQRSPSSWFKASIDLIHFQKSETINVRMNLLCKQSKSIFLLKIWDLSYMLRFIEFHFQFFQIQLCCHFYSSGKKISIWVWIRKDLHVTENSLNKNKVRTRRSVDWGILLRKLNIRRFFLRNADIHRCSANSTGHFLRFLSAYGSYCRKVLDESSNREIHRNSARWLYPDIFKVNCSNWQKQRWNGRKHDILTIHNEMIDFLFARVDWTITQTPLNSANISNYSL